MQIKIHENKRKIFRCFDAFELLMNFYKLDLIGTLKIPKIGTFLRHFSSMNNKNLMLLKAFMTFMNNKQLNKKNILKKSENNYFFLQDVIILILTGW